MAENPCGIHAFIGRRAKSSGWEKLSPYLYPALRPVLLREFPHQLINQLSFRSARPPFLSRPRYVVEFTSCISPNWLSVFGML